SMEEIETLTKPLEDELREAGLALLLGQSGGVTRPLVLPLVDGQPVPPERFAAMMEEGKLSPDALTNLEQAGQQARERVDATFRRVAELQRSMRRRMREALREEATRLLQEACA